MSTKQIKARLEYLRRELRSERISYGELNELQALAEHIPADDLELREAAGFPEFPEKQCVKIEIEGGCVVAVDSLPEGWTYEVVDHDCEKVGGV